MFLQPAQRTGTIASNNGNAKTSANIASHTEAVAGLYLSALKWINGGTLPANAARSMNVSNPAKVMVI